MSTVVDTETGEVLPVVADAAVQLGTLRATSPAELIAGAEVWPAHRPAPCARLWNGRTRGSSASPASRATPSARSDVATMAYRR